MSAHTPGPWRFEPRIWNTPDAENREASDGSIVSLKNGERDWFVARVDNAPQAEANARLIAAAPELYEALEFCVLVLMNIAPAGGVYNPALTKARAAIAKAEGRTEAPHVG
jgi:hypothetical protein